MLRLILAIVVLTSLAACGSRLNPFNWFGGDREQRITVEETGEIVDPRGLVPEIIALSVDPVPQGAIIRAMGRPATQGHWAADLVLLERTESSLVYEFRLLPPPEPNPQGTPASREVITGISLSNGELEGIRSITVIGGLNRRTVSRR